MSAHAMKSQAEKMLRDLVDEHAETLASRAQDDFGTMRYNQGIIAGLRLAMEIQQEAYKRLGG